MEAKPKKILTVLIIVVLIFIGLLSVKFYPAVKNYLKERQIYASDKIGGATPEETYQLFVNALKEKNIDLASRYFVPEAQSQWLKTFTIYNQSGNLQNFIDELIHNQSVWQKQSSDKKEAIYQIEGNSLIIFEKNPVNGIWKIKDL